jgi:2-aminoethylphosphonate-pyruvate transaminase
VESVLSTVVNKDSGVFIIANGAYGVRMTQICRAHKIAFVLYELPDDTPPDLALIEKYLTGEAAKVSAVAVVHSETTSGIVNDVESIGAVVGKYQKTYIVDSMSAFGAVPVDFSRGKIDFLVSSSNKCIEGVPGFSFAIARKSALNSAKGNASSLALDLHSQCAGLDQSGQFRFTPPTHSLLAFYQALLELQLEGGVKGRAARYKENQRILNAGLAKLGFELYLKPQQQGYIISSYHYAKDKNWNFNEFYNQLNSAGFVIYPGKVSKADCFRIGHIGRIFPQDTQKLVQQIDRVCKEMKTAKYFPK